MGSGVATDVGVGALVDIGTGVAVGASKRADIGGVVGIGFCVDVGMGVSVGSGCFIVRAKMLKESTWAVALEAVKSTAVCNWVQVPARWC